MIGASMEEADRVSQLPDELLHQILSLIDINQAVQTAILSRRWRNLWRSISDLHFRATCVEATYFYATSNCCVSLENYEAAEAFSLRFSHFVSHFLSHRDAAAPIRTFHLSLDRRAPADGEFVEECALYAVTHGVQSLRLDARCFPAPTLPAVFFASTTLRELELRLHHCGLEVVGRFSLPHLKTLRLQGSVFFDDQAYSKEPFSGFPALEKLSLYWFTLAGVVLRAPNLTFLHIVEGNLFSHVMEEISAPLLTSFKFETHHPLQCSNLNLPMLEELYLNVHKSLNEKGMELRCVGMLHQLGNAKIVALTLDTLKVLEMDRDLIEKSPPPFPYMKNLKLMKGHREIHKVQQSVIKYLTVGTLNYESLVVEFPADGVSVVEEASQDLFDDYDYSDLFD